MRTMVEAGRRLRVGNAVALFPGALSPPDQPILMGTVTQIDGEIAKVSVEDGKWFEAPIWRLSKMKRNQLPKKYRGGKLRPAT